MPANVALTNTELSHLNAADHQVPHYLSFHADTVIATADVATTPTGEYVLQIAVTNTVNWTKIREGMTAKITNAGATVLRGYYRVQNGGSSTALLIEQIAFADPGSIANNNRSDIIQSLDKISIIERFDLYSMKPLTIGTTAFQDGTIPVGTQNLTPEVIVNVAINSQPGDFVTSIASDGGTQHISAAVTISKWPTSSGSTLSYAWITPASWTNITGSATATLGADVPPGDYILYCQVTDSIASVTQEICRWVRIHSPGDPPLAVNVTSDDETRQGRKMTVRAVQGIIGPIPPGAKCCITGPYTWGGADVATANHTFVGYLYNQPFMHEPNYYESSADVWGVGAILDTLIGAPVTLKYAGTPITWEEVAPSLSTVQFAIWWTLRWRCANALKCFNFTDFSLLGTLARRQNIPVPQGTIYAQVKALADMYDANVGSRPDGEIIVQRLPSILQDRSGVATRCTLDNSIYKDVYVTWKRRNEYGDVFHSGVYISDSALTADVQVQGEAPGLQTFGQGGKADRKSGKVYETEVDNIIRVGYWLSLLNNEYPQVKVDIPNNWDVFVMADLNRVIVNVPANKSPTGSAISITCIPLSMTKKWMPGRRASITLVLEAETTGTAGEDVPIPPQLPPQPIPINPISILPITPLLPPVPDPGGSVTPIVPYSNPHQYPTNGDVLATTSFGSVYITPDAVSKHAPDWNNITPGTLGAFVPQRVVFDPFGATAGTAIGLYALTLDSAGSQSQVQYAPCAALVAPVWTPGTVLGSANYTTIRTTLAQAGGVLLYGSGNGQTTTITTTFDAGGYPYTIVPSSNSGYSATVQSGGNPGNCLAGQIITSGSPGPGFVSDAYVKMTLAQPSTVTLVSLDTMQTGRTLYGWGILLYDVGNNLLAAYTGAVNPATSGTWYNVGSGAISVANVSYAVFDISATTDVGETCFLDNCLITYTVGLGGGANVVYSSDYGATFGSPLTMGGTKGGGGFDVSRNSGASFAGGYGTVYKATSLGGAYSAYSGFGSANPTSITVPWFRRNSTATGQTTSGTPDIIVGLDSGTLGLCWLTGGTAAPVGTVDITPAAGFHPAGPDAITCSYGKYMAAISTGGTLYESNNAGSTWTAIGSFSSGAACRVRRNDVSELTGRGVLFALDSAGAVNYTSHLIGHGPLYPRVGLEPYTSFDVYP